MRQAPDRRVRRGHRRPGVGRALLLTAASTIVPGTAHLTRRRWVVGGLLYSLFVVVVGLLAFAATRERAQLLSLAVDPRWLMGILIGAVVVAVLWCANVVWSYLAVRPGGLSPVSRVVGGVTVAALCALVCAPLGLAANYAQAQRGLVTHIFPDAEISGGSDGNASDPWGQGERLNVLLLGGDADPSRPGVRTDVMIVASIDPQTGRTVLLSVPRNLMNAPMPFPAMQREFPAGFPKFLYALWRYGTKHPEMVPGTDKPGAHLLTETMQEILGIPVKYYALVDLDGFKAIVNALGGVWIDVQEPIPYGDDTDFVIEAGYRPLTGREALWYARSREGTSDYDRMRRQRCLIGALAKQADPMTVLRNFRELTHATKRTVSTSIPRDLLPDLIDLVPKIRNAKITNVQLVPPVIDTGDPDYAKIQRIVERTLDQAEGSATRESKKPPVRADTPTEPPARAGAMPGDTPTTPPQGGGEPPEGQPGQPSPAETTSSGSGAGPVSLQAACPRTDAPE